MPTLSLKLNLTIILTLILILTLTLVPQNDKNPPVVDIWYGDGACNTAVNLPLHHKVQKFSSDAGLPGWSQKRAIERLWCDGGGVVV